MTFLQTTMRRRLAAATLVCALPLLLPAQVYAVDFDKSVFEYQSKLANKGNAEAQYYLAQMYEEGRGTKADPELAKQWFDKARNNGYLPAEKTASN